MSRIKFIGGLLACLLLTACAAPAEPAATTAPAPVSTNYQTDTAELGTFRKTEKCGAQLDCTMIENLVCEADDAILKENLAVRRGDAVKKGDVLATFVHETSEAQRQRLEYQLDEAKRAKENGVSQYYRQLSNMSSSDEISRLQKLQVEYDLGIYQIQAQQAVDAAQKRLDDYMERYEEHTITAPFDGYVYWVEKVSAGDPIAKGRQLMTVLNPAYICMRLESPSEELQKMAVPGMPVRVKAGGKDHRAVIAATPNGVKEGQDNLTIYITGSWMNKIQDERVHGSVECTVLELENMLMVDRKAIRTDGTTQYVMVLQDGTLLKRNVLVGPENDQVCCILDGLSEGQQVVLN